MKTMKKILALLVVLVGFSIHSFSQITASADAYATIVTPISLTWEVDLNFGNLAVTNVSGNVALTPSATPVRTVGGLGGVTLPVQTGTVTAARFSVGGTPDYTYAITLPTDCTIKNNLGVGPETMLVHDFTSAPTPSGHLDMSGLQILYVGATVEVAAFQAAGTYKSDVPFDVMVNYN
jgi:hypothetical protein